MEIDLGGSIVRDFVRGSLVGLTGESYLGPARIADARLGLQAGILIPYRYVGTSAQ